LNNELNLKLIKEDDFLGIKCDFYKDSNNNIYMTREQVGKALQYSDPIRNISKLHERNKERLDRFSVVVKLTTTDKKQYDTTLYIERGIYEVCRFSKQPVANDFYDWVYDKVELIRKTAGTVQEGREKEFLDNYFSSFSEETKLLMVKELQDNVERQQKQIQELAPKAENWSAYMDTKGNITMANLAKSLNIKGIGRNKLFKLLRDKKVLRSNNEPYQSYVDREYFEVVNGIKNGFKYTQTIVTGKGMEWINKKIKEWGYAS
jgi:phage antirepressor YoqD-like protein